MNMATRMITIMMAILVAILQSVDARDAGRMIDVRDAQAKAELVSECVCGDEAASNYNCPALPAANNWGCTYKSDCSDLQKWLARRFDVSDTITEDMCHINQAPWYIKQRVKTVTELARHSIRRSDRHSGRLCFQASLEWRSNHPRARHCPWGCGPHRTCVASRRDMARWKTPGWPAPTTCQDEGT
jgi:hypothetical protein